MKPTDLKYKKDNDYKNSLECKQLQEWVGMDKRILEVGCHTADLGRLLKDNGNYVVGVDYNAEAIEEAKQHIQEAYIINLETETSKIDNLGMFDVIICNQVFEHLRNSEAVVAKLMKCLNPNGIFIIGLPNICNAKDRFNITWGQWKYTQIGVMDSTHVRFFSYYSALDFIKNAGLKVDDYHSSWQVNPLWEFFDHVPLLCKFRNMFNEHKPGRRFSRNATDVVMIFKCSKL